MAEADQPDMDSVNRIAAWAAMGAGLFFVLISFGFLYLGLNMLIWALEGDYVPLSGVSMLVIWVAMLLLGLFVFRWGLRIRRTLREKEHAQTNQDVIKPEG